ncbi:MAG: EAL domain-containing protein, partial [Pseudorhodoplanes sp.]
PAHLELLRRAAFTTAAIKELSILAPDGAVMCSDVGLQLGPRLLISSQPLNARGVFLDLIQLAGTRMVRLRVAPGNMPGLAALLPTEIFLAQTSTDGGPISAYMRIAMRDGTIISERRAADTARLSQDLLSASLTSEAYGLKVDTALDREAVSQMGHDLRALGMAATGVMAILLCIFALLAPRDPRRNPVTDIERALKAGEFIPYYQPIVDISSGRLLGAEVLVRWRKADGTMVPPGAFIPIAESSGLIIALTRELMRLVLQEVGPALASRPQFKISFNLAAQHFNDEMIVDDVQRIFAQSPIRLSQVMLEVTERQPLENLTVARRVIAALQGIGVRIAIDDVGTGHSGLSYMLKLGVDVIKVDKMFIDALGHDANSTAIIETLIDLARNMRMEVVAEGVETFEQVVSLRERGIYSAQGFVFAPPLPGRSFLQLLDAVDPKSETRLPQRAA